MYVKIFKYLPDVVVSGIVVVSGVVVVGTVRRFVYLLFHETSKKI